MELKGEDGTRAHAGRRYNTNTYTKTQFSELGL